MGVELAVSTSSWRAGTGSEDDISVEQTRGENERGEEENPG